MAQPMRKSPRSESPTPSPERPSVERADNDTKNRSERITLDPNLMRSRDVHIAATLRHTFPYLARKEASGELTVLMVGAASEDVRDVSLVGGWNIPRENITLIEGSKQDADALAAKSLPAKRVQLEKYVGEKASDVVMVLDEEMKLTSKFLQNVAHLGFLICRADLAVGAMRTGKFSFRGLLKPNGHEWMHVASQEYGMVQNNEQFEKAEGGNGSVTYKEAKKKLEEVGRPTKNVFVEYKQLIDETVAQNEGTALEGQTTLTYTDDEENTFEINTALPSADSDNKTFYVLERTH